MNILIALLSLSFLIIIHEFGHFTVAKLSGIKVHEFALFMGPKLFSIQRGETMYSIRLIPLGGYVKMEGEEEASEDSRAFNKKPVLVRAAVIAAGPIMNLLTALVIILIITSTSGYHTTKIGIIDTTSASAQAGIREGDTIVNYGDKRVYNMLDLQVFMLYNKGKPVDVKFIRNGKEEHATVAPEIIPKNRYIIGFTPKEPFGEGSNIVNAVFEDSAAYQAGLRPNDRIIMINASAISNNRDIRNFMNKNAGVPINMTVQRNNKTELIEIKPFMDKNDEQYNIGFGFVDEPASMGNSVKESFIYAYAISRNIYYQLLGLLTGVFSMSQMAGPVGLVSAIGNVVEQSPNIMLAVLNLLSFTALISINLGLFNLIPFPALDGSKLLLLAIEGIRRKALPPEKEAFITMIGFALLIMLMIFATSNDILRLLGKG